jgi:hypothetical protein
LQSARRLAVGAAPRCRSLAMRENREVAELCCGNTL